MPIEHGQKMHVEYMYMNVLLLVRTVISVMCFLQCWAAETWSHRMAPGCHVRVTSRLLAVSLAASPGNCNALTTSGWDLADNADQVQYAKLNLIAH